MAFTINQNFDLKSRRKDFARQELTLAQLKSTRDADYPDDYEVVIGGKIYIFNSTNSADATLGKWREFAPSQDLSGYVKKTQKVNGKALSGDIELKARDIKVTVGGAEVTLQANNDLMGKNYTALNNKVNGLGTKGAANGLASLDGSGKVPSSQLPSYVDDVVEFNSIPISNPGDAFEDGDAPEGSTIVFVKDTGCFIAQNDSSIYSSWSGCESFGTKTENGVKPDGGKIYVTTQNNKTWRWSGSAMVEISASLALGETSATAYAGDKGKANRDALNALPGTVATGFTVSPDKTAVSFNLQIRKKGSNNQYGSSNVIDTKTIPAATASAAGVMAAGDKSKLDGIATGATADSALTTSEIDALLV